jgi:hypothetical protein
VGPLDDVLSGRLHLCGHGLVGHDDDGAARSFQINRLVSFVFLGDDDVTMLMWRNENAEKYLSGSLLYRRYRFGALLLQTTTHGFRPPKGERVRLSALLYCK